MEKHLAGIIPVYNIQKRYSILEQSLMNIGPEYLAIERSVIECSQAGCVTIWIACPPEISTLIRKRVGDYTFDLTSTDEKSLRRKIPIYYVDSLNQELLKFDCPVFATIQTAKLAYNCSKQITQWLVPEVFYVSQPYGVYDTSALVQNRENIISDDSFVITHQRAWSVYDGCKLGFTFKAFEISELEERYENRKKKLWLHDFNEYPAFKDILEEDDFNSIDVDWYYDISDWYGYRDFCSEQKRMHMPEKNLMGNKLPLFKV